MIGDAYFQLRAQIGTAHFSLLRLASELGASESIMAALQEVQNGLRETLLLLAAGDSEDGVSRFLECLFEREFSGVPAASSAGRPIIIRHGSESCETPLSSGLIESQRPHSFLRNFTIVRTPMAESGRPIPAELGDFFTRADAVFFVITADAIVADVCARLASLGREALRRIVFVVWQKDQASGGDRAIAVKRMRQAMLKHLGQACPIFALSAEDEAGRRKLIRWLEREVIFSAPRRRRLEEFDHLAQETLREVSGPPEAAERAWHRAHETLTDLRQSLAELEEQSERQIAGTLWKLAQSFDGVRKRGETLLRSQFGIGDLFRKQTAWRAEWARELETQARDSLAVQTTDALDGLEEDWRRGGLDHEEHCREMLGEKLPGEPPVFPREKLAESLADRDAPLELDRALTAALATAAQLLRLPVWAAGAAILFATGTVPFAGIVESIWVLAAGNAAFVLVLSWLLRDQVIAAFGRHFTANRLKLLTAVETLLRTANEQYYAALAKPLEGRLSVHDAERHRHEPVLSRIRQLEETFRRIDAELRAGAVSQAPGDEESR